MKRSRGLLVITGLLGVGVCGVMLRSASTGADAERPPGANRSAGGAATPESVELAEMRQELAQLRAQLRNQAQRLAAGDSAREVQVPDGKNPGNDPELRADEARKHREYVTAVDVAFRNEATDPRWSSATSSTVRSVIAASDDLRPLAREVECRSRTCRVEITDDGSGKLGKLLPVFAQQVGHELPSVSADRVEDASGAATMVLYLARNDDAPASGTPAR